jgi:hypothetical protein
MTKNIVIAGLCVVLIWFGAAIVRLENYRYASNLGMCGNYDPLTAVKRERCLEHARTRTNPIYNLLYGLKVL